MLVRPRHLSLLIFGAQLLGISHGFAQSETVDEDTVVRLAIQHSPLLKASGLEWRAQRALVEGEEHRYGYTFRSETSAQRSETLSADGDRRLETDENKALDVQLTLERRLALGSVLSLGAGVNVERNSVPRDDRSLGPTYALETQLAITQPLLRGAGREVGESELRQARLLEASANHARERATSETLLAALSAYWELWYATRALEIQRQSHAALVQQHEQAGGMVATGALAEADALPFETRALALEDAVLQSRLDLRRRAIELAAVIGLEAPEHVELAAGTEPSLAYSAPTESGAAVRDALARSEELEELQATVQLARERARIAGEPLRPRLDLGASISLSGLGDRDLAPPLEQIGQATAVSGLVSATLELPLDSTQRRNQAASAQLLAEAASARMQLRVKQISASVLNALSRIELSRQRVERSEHGVRTAQELVKAQEGRFRTGLGTALQVLDAQEELRAAQLRSLRSQTDGGTARLLLAQLTGTLLAKHPAVLRALPAPKR